MNSIFSSFDALSAEFLGYTFRSSFASSSSSYSSSSSTTNSKADLKGGKDTNTPCPAAAAGGGVGSKSSCRKSKAPRFAPELDGLHCFETFVTY